MIFDRRPGKFARGGIIAIALAGGVFLSGCAGQDQVSSGPGTENGGAEPQAVVELANGELSAVNFSELTCPQIKQAITANVSEIETFGDDGVRTQTKVASVVAGVFLMIPLAFLDPAQQDRERYAALRTRGDRLDQLAAAQNCPPESKRSEPKA